MLHLHEKLKTNLLLLLKKTREVTKDLVVRFNSASTCNTLYELYCGLWVFMSPPFFFVVLPPLILLVLAALVCAQSSYVCLVVKIKWPKLEEHICWLYKYLKYSILNSVLWFAVLLNFQLPWQHKMHINRCTLCLCWELTVHDDFQSVLQSDI